MYINLDLISLEAHFIDAKTRGDDRRMYFITIAYLINKYNKTSQFHFFTEHLELLEKNNYDYKLFSRSELKGLNKIFDKKSRVFTLKDSCWI